MNYCHAPLVVQGCNLHTYIISCTVMPSVAVDEAHDMQSDMYIIWMPIGRCLISDLRCKLLYSIGPY